MSLIRNTWNPASASGLDSLELLRYRSNALGADLRITNFGGGNTSSKYEDIDPFTGKPTTVMAVKGSGGDLGSIKRSGFAVLYQDKLEQLISRYRGEAHEDEMVAYYPSCAFNNNTVPASIDTPLHGFLPFPHVDHLHPDWAIALAASANGKSKMAEFNQRYKRNLVWLPWQRPGFELGLMLRRAVQENPGCDGIVLASHGLFTWGNTQEESYVNSLAIINELGAFVLGHQQRAGDGLFGGQKHTQRTDAAKVVTRLFPLLRGHVATARRSIGHFLDSEAVARFCNSAWAADLAGLGTSCPDHFIRTRIAPLLVDWNPENGSEAHLGEALEEGLEAYRRRYTKYYEAHAEPDSPKLRDANPSVVLVPGIGMFSFGRNKKEARITGEFYVNAINVMAGATSMEDASSANGAVPHSKHPERAAEFTRFHNYVALPPREAFRIEYWALEEAKIQRMPAEKEFARRIFVVIGGGSGVGRAVCKMLAAGGAHLTVADINADLASEAAADCAKLSDMEFVASHRTDITNRGSLDEAVAATILRFGGIDGVVNTAAMGPGPLKDGQLPEDQWRAMMDRNVTANYILTDVVKPVFAAQNLSATIVLTSSANAVVPKAGTESYDVSKSAVSHLVRQLAMGMAPLIRVNGVAPATVVEGSLMFPRDRVIMSLRKYGFQANEEESDDVLRDRLAAYYASRTLTKLPIRPQDCAEAILYLSSERSSRTTGHVIPVDGGLPEAFLR